MTARALQQLYAIRLLVDGLIADIESAATTREGCPHPPEKQLNATTMGGPSLVLCVQCGETRPGTVPTQ